MSDITESILIGLEWDEGLSMPVANTENKHLETLIQNKQTSIVTVQDQMDEAEESVRTMSEHRKNLQQQLQNTQFLASSREKELQTEQHMLKLSEREEGRLRQEVSHLMKEMDRLKDKRNSFEKNIVKQTRKLEELRSQLDWDEEALDAWFVECTKKDEDAMTIQKYTRQDEVTIQKLSFQIEKLIADAWRKKQQLNLEVTNTVTNQIELDKVAEIFRNAHLEREELLLQWESTIDLMRKRDRDMEHLEVKLAEIKAVVRRNNNIVRNKLQHLRREQDNNAETEKTISLTERTSILIKKQLTDAEQQTMQFESETEAFRRSLDKIVCDLELTYSSLAQVKKEIADKSIKLEQATATRIALDKKLKDVIASTLSVGQQATELDDLLMAEDKRQAQLLRELKLLEALMCKSQRTLNDIKVEEKIMEAAINCAANTSKNFASKILRLDADTLKQQEIIYNQNLHIMQLEKRCYQMEGEHASEEKFTLEIKVNELTETLEEKDRNHTSLLTQLRLVQENQLRVKRDLTHFSTEKAEMLSKIDDCNLYNRGYEMELRNLIKEKQNLMVEESLMKLEIRKIQDLLNSKEDDIMSMEMRKKQLDTAMTERRREIKNHQEMLQANIKINEEERQQVNSELYNKLSRIEKLKIRYRFLVIPMMPPGSDEDKSQVYCLIKNAEEKEMLQREGDELDANIRKAEKEIVALENTLKLLNGRNDLYQQSFRKLSESSEEMNVKRDLNEQMKVAIDKYRYKKRQIKELQDDLQAVTSDLEKLTNTEHDTYVELDNKKNKYLKVKKEIVDQYEKLTRAGKHNARLVRELRSASKDTEELPEEKDINVREMRELNRSLVAMITDSLQMLPDVLEAAQIYFAEAEIPSPTNRGLLSKPSSQLSSRQESVLSVSLSAEVCIESTQSELVGSAL